MTETRTASSSVVVNVDPATAFVAFTDEINLWWMRSPISFYDASRAVAKRIERGIGGRILEVYDDDTGDVLELGRITIWEPGKQLAWRSSVDDIDVDIRFEPTEGGTRVDVVAQVQPDGDPTRTGSFSIARVVPDWFGGWCQRRDTAPREPVDLARLNLAVYYAKPVTAARWLSTAYGFALPGGLPEDGEDAMWIEFHVGNTALLLFKTDETGADRAAGSPTHMPWVYVDDLDAHYQQAVSAGTRIVEGIHQHGYRAYITEDLEGHRWTFAQARPTMAG